MMPMEGLSAQVIIRDLNEGKRKKSMYIWWQGGGGSYEENSRKRK